jgi:hypothetical protein
VTQDSPTNCGKFWGETSWLGCRNINHTETKGNFYYAPGEKVGKEGHSCRNGTTGTVDASHGVTVGDDWTWSVGGPVVLEFLVTVAASESYSQTATSSSTMTRAESWFVRGERVRLWNMIGTVSGSTPQVGADGAADGL